MLRKVWARIYDLCRGGGGQDFLGTQKISIGKKKCQKYFQPKKYAFWYNPIYGSLDPPPFSKVCNFFFFLRDLDSYTLK